MSKILIDSDIFSKTAIKTIEEKQNATYVCETCLRQSGVWVNTPVAVFHNNDPENIPADGSPWFGLFYRDDPYDKRTNLYICNAITATEHLIQGLEADNGDIIYSRYRHDFRRSPDGSVWIDGGRDYFRWGGNGSPVVLRIEGNTLKHVGYGYVDDFEKALKAAE